MGQLTGGDNIEFARGKEGVQWRENGSSGVNSASMRLRIERDSTGNLKNDSKCKELNVS